MLCKVVKLLVVVTLKRPIAGLNMSFSIDASMQSLFILTTSLDILLRIGFTVLALRFVRLKLRRLRRTFAIPALQQLVGVQFNTVPRLAYRPMLLISNYSLQSLLQVHTG
jgi:hypothetical protein